MAIYKKLNLPKGVQLSIQRFLGDQFLVGVTGVIFNDQGEVLLFKHSYRQVEWSLPGGYLKAKEDPKAGLIREIKEESGFDVKVLKIIASKHDIDTARLNIIYYGVFKGGKFKPSDEVTECGFFSKSELPKLINDQYKQINAAYSRYHPSLMQNFISIFKRNR